MIPFAQRKAIPSYVCRVVLAAGLCWAGHAADAPPVALADGVAAQPLAAQVQRLINALDYLGEPLGVADRTRLEAASRSTSPLQEAETVQSVLDRACLLIVDISPEMRVTVSPGPAKPALLEQGWRSFLIKVRNAAGTTAALRVVSPQAQSLFLGGESLTPNAPVLRNPSDRAFQASAAAASLAPRDRWIDVQFYANQPLTKSLSGLALEYRIIQIYSRDAGPREATLAFDVGQGTQDLGFRSELPILFQCAPAYPVTWRVRDENGRPAIASFVIRDASGRTYPAQAKRLAPDFAFQPQVYRGEGDVVRLPAGTYSVVASRGPESIRTTQALVVPPHPTEAHFQIERWIDPSKLGWWSGDYHIHAAGCLHYTKPTEGVRPEDMIRHLMGEDLKIGAALTWGPGFDYQSQFFCGAVDGVSRYPYLLRYDIEISGFGSHRSGHHVLLRLKDQHYPGSHSTDGWPTLGLATLRWAKRQGAVVGCAHSGWGLAVPDNRLPSYEIPRFDGIGAMEYIVDVTHEVPGPDGKLTPAVDFISALDSPLNYELNIWYHTLNAGFRTRIGGETDFPCVYSERVGMGRTYVKLDGPLNYDAWCEGIRQGRSYVSDGKSHLLGFRVNGLGVGEQGSELKLALPGTVHLTVQAAALLAAQTDPAWHTLSSPDPGDDRPFWDLERARIGQSREVPVEVVVNGYPVARRNLVADGLVRDLAFDVHLDRSSWVALRILGSSHTNPVFVLAGDKPIRASRRSLAWCLKCVDQCWSQKSQFISPGEMAAARLAYEQAREIYRARMMECDID